MKKKRYARTWLRKHLMKAHASAVRMTNGPDSDAVHDFRVALRRARTLMRAYEPFLDNPMSAKDARFLRVMARSLGLARDLHVFREKMVELKHRLGTPSFDAGYFLRRLAKEERRRTASLRPLLSRYFSMEKRLLETIRPGARAVPLPSAYLRWARKWLLKRCKKLKKTLRNVDGPDDRRLHKARIHSKKLRYVAETISGDSNSGARFVRTAEYAQTVLGDIHDLIGLEAAIRKEKNKRRFSEEKALAMLEAIQRDKRRLFKKNEKKIRLLPKKLEDILG